MRRHISSKESKSERKSQFSSPVSHCPHHPHIHYYSADVQYFPSTATTRNIHGVRHANKRTKNHWALHLHRKRPGVPTPLTAPTLCLTSRSRLKRILSDLPQHSRLPKPSPHPSSQHQWIRPILPQALVLPSHFAVPPRSADLLVLWNLSSSRILFLWRTPIDL